MSAVIVSERSTVATQGLPSVIFLSGYIAMFAGQNKPSPFILSQQEALEAIGARVYPFYTRGRRFIKYPASLLRYRRFVRTTPADLVHAHYSYNGALALCQRQKPVVISLLGGDVFVSQIAGAGEPVRALVTQVITQVTALKAAQVIVKSEAMRRQLWRKSGVHVIPNGVNLDMFTPMARQEARHSLGLDPERPYVLFPASRHRPEKDFPLAEATFRQVARAIPGAELITLEGVPRETMPFYLNAANVILFTSKSEGAPNVIKEAMACNVPIVSVDVGDVREVIEGVPGCWLGPRDPLALAALAVEAIGLDRPSEGRQRIQRYDNRTVAYRIVEVYRQALASPTGARSR